MGDQGYGINPEVLRIVAGEIAETAKLGVEVAVVVGGGNIFRGVSRVRARAWTARARTTSACSRP